MSDLRSKIIRLAHQQPALRPHLLPLLKEAMATKVPKEIVDPESGKNYEDLKAEYKATEAKMYEEWNNLQSLKLYRESDALSKKIDVYRKEVGNRLERLRIRTEKAKRGLRLSSNPKYMAGLPGRGDWGYLGPDSEVSAILRSDEVVGWVVGKTRSAFVRAPSGNTSVGNQVWKEYTAYTLEGKKVGYGGARRTTDALDEFHRATQI